jgi:hypothetical protein
MAQMYGITGIAEATEYLRDPLLRTRWLAIGRTIAEKARAGNTLETLMGSSIDVTKLVSSLTLFGSVAKRLSAEEGHEDYGSLSWIADELIGVAASEGYPPCRFTLDHLRRSV